MTLRAVVLQVGQVRRDLAPEVGPELDVRDGHEGAMLLEKLVAVLERRLALPSGGPFLAPCRENENSAPSH